MEVGSFLVGTTPWTLKILTKPPQKKKGPQARGTKIRSEPESRSCCAMDGTMVLDRRPLATGLIVFVKFCDEEVLYQGP